jgi:hypothetical protein
MLKLDQATYSLGGRTSSWAKYKVVRTIKAIVTGKTKKKRSPKQKKEGDTWVYDAAIGPVPADTAERFKDPVFYDGKVYVPIGKTFGTAIDLGIGDKLEVEVTEILLDMSDKLWKINWFTPVVKDQLEKTARTTSLDEVMDMLKPEEVKKAFDEVVPETVEICKGQEERFVLGIVLEPEVVDGQNEVVSAAEIRETCHRFMEMYRELGAYHTEANKGRMVILENYIAPVDFEIDGREVKRGTWLMGIRILDDELWQKVKTGKINGLSIFGTSRRVRERPIKEFEFAEVD